MVVIIPTMIHSCFDCLGGLILFRMMTSNNVLRQLNNVAHPTSASQTILRL